MCSHDDDVKKKKTAPLKPETDTEPGSQPAPEAGGAGEQAESARKHAERLAELEQKVPELESALARSGEQLAAATGERDAWQSKAGEIYDQYLRAKADFESFRKRTERDFDDRLTRGKADFLKGLLDVMDSFQRFLQATERGGPESGKNSFDAFLKGVAMIERQLMDALLKEGAEPIDNPVGKPLNPEVHEVVAVQEGGGEHGTVVEELHRGYMYRGLVLRPAKVKVAR